MARGGGRRWRIVAWAAGIAVGVPVILVAAVTVLIHEDAAATWLTRQALERVEFWPEADVTVGYVDVTGFWRLTVRDLRVGPSGPGRPPMVTADEIEGRLRVLPLLRRRLTLGQVRATNVAVTMLQRADSTWDLLAPFLDPADAAPDDTASGSWEVAVASAELLGDLRAEFHAAADSVLLVEDLTLRARDIATAPGNLRVTLDTLGARILPPARPESPAQLSAVMDLRDHTLTMDARLLSDSSDVTARGTLRLPGGAISDFRQADFHVAAVPLDFRDVGAFLPGMDVPGSVRLEAAVRGSAELVEIDVDGRSFDGATIEVRGSATPRTSGSLRYMFEATIRDLVPSLWIDGESPVDGVDADVSLDVGGPALDALTGTASIVASASRLVSGTLPETRADVVFERGLATFDLRGTAAPWAGVVASGTARPFDALPTYAVRATVDQLERAGGERTRVSAGSVVLEVEGRGFDPHGASGRASLTIDGRLGDAEVRGGTVEGSWSDGSGQAQLDVPVGDGRVAASLTGSWGGDAARVDLSAFDVTRLDVGALLGDSVAGTLSMNGTGEVVWGENGTRAGEIDAVLEGGRWGGAVLDTGRVRATLRQGDLTAAGVLVSAAGDVEIDASARPFDEVRTWRVERLATEGLDLSRAAEGLPSSAITATLSMEGTLPPDPRMMTASGSLALARSTIGPERVDTAEVRLSYGDGLLELDGEADAMEGSLLLVAAARPLENVPTFRLERLEFDDVRPDSAWAGPATLELSGILTAEGSMPPEGLPRVDAVLEFEPSLLNGGRVEGARAVLTLADGHGIVDAELRSPGGRLDIDGEAEFVRNEEGTRIVSLIANGGAELPDLHTFLRREGPAELHGRFGVAGGRTDTGALEWSGVATASGALGAARLDALEVSGGVTDGILRLDTLHVASNVVRGSGGGAIALADSMANGPGAPAPEGLTVHLVVDSIDALAEETPVRPLSLRSASLELRATHPEGGIRLEALFGAGGAIAAGFGADTISGVATARVVDGTLTGGTARLRGSRLGAGAARFESVQGDVAYDSAYGAQFAFGVRQDEAHEVHLAGTAHPEDSMLELDSLRISLPEQQWTLARPTTVRWGERFDAGGLTLEASPGRIALDGVLDPDGVQDLTLVLESVRLDGFADLIGIERLQGSVGGRLALAGPADEVGLSGMVDATVQGVRANVTLEPSAEGHTVAALLRDGLGGTLEAAGSVPLTISFAGDAGPAPSDAALDVTATSFAIDWLAPFLAPFGVEQVGGLLHADARVEGGLEAPRLSGTARIAGGVIRVPDQGVVYQSIDGTFELMGDRIGVRDLRMASGGSAVIEGDVILDPFPDPTLDLVATFDRFQAAQNEWTRLAMSGELTVMGTLSAPEIGGSVRIADTDIYADPVGAGGGGAPVQLTDEDYAMLESYFGYRPGQDAAFEEDPILGWAVDVGVELERDVWLRKSAQPELRLELGGSLDVTKAAGDSIQLFGTIEVVPERSYFEEFGRRFDVTEGTVTFNGSIWGWQADVGAQYEVASFRDPSAPEVVIVLEVDGGLDDLEVVMGSDPTMETADILSYIATGRPAESAVAFGGAGQGGGNGVVGLGTSLALDRVAGALEDVAAEGAGLDVVEIRQRPEGATVVAGRYVSPRLFVGVRQPLTRSRAADALGRTARGTEVELEYSWASWLLMSLQGGESTVSFFLRTKHAF